MTKVLDFISGSIDELKRIQWPSKQETTRLTIYVVAASFGVGLFVMMFDYVFANLLTLLITK